jgi:hypothetical protein
MLSGRVRQQLLNEAIAASNHQQVKAIFDRFRNRSTGTTSSRSTSRRSSASAPFYTRDRIKELYEQHRRGAFAGREADWDAIEQDLFRAQREGRVEQKPYLTK